MGFPAVVSKFYFAGNEIGLGEGVANAQFTLIGSKSIFWCRVVIQNPGTGGRCRLSAFVGQFGQGVDQFRCGIVDIAGVQRGSGHGHHGAFVKPGLRSGGEHRGVVLGQNHDRDGGRGRCEVTSGGVANGVGERCRAAEIGCGGEDHGVAVAVAVAVGVIRQRNRAAADGRHGNNVQRQVAAVIADQLRFGKVKRGVFVGDKGVCNGNRGCIGRRAADTDRDRACRGLSVAVLQGVGEGRRPGVARGRREGNVGSREGDAAIAGTLNAGDAEVGVAAVVGHQLCHGRGNRRVLGRGEVIGDCPQVIDHHAHRGCVLFAQGVLDGVGEAGRAVAAIGAGTARGEQHVATAESDDPVNGVADGENAQTGTTVVPQQFGGRKCPHYIFKRTEGIGHRNRLHINTYGDILCVIIPIVQGVGKRGCSGETGGRGEGDGGSVEGDCAILRGFNAGNAQAGITHVVGQQSAGGNGKYRVLAGNQRIRSPADRKYVDRNRRCGCLRIGVLHGIGERGIAGEAGGRGEGDGLSRCIPHGRAIGYRSYTGDGERLVASVVTEKLGRRENSGANISGDIFQHGKRISDGDSRDVRGKVEGDDKRRQGAVQITPTLPVPQGNGEGISILSPVMHVGK